VTDAHIFWYSVREQQHAFFAAAKTLWRLSLPSTAPSVTLPGQQLIEWGGALRWLASDVPAADIRRAATALGGHATLFRSAGAIDEPFQPLSAPLLEIHKRLKQRFDPHHIFNPGRMYSGL
jgi:glycolate oxidase FAD binding subunit